MKTEFDPLTHIGKVDGEIWPSTTQLIKEAKLVDYSMVPADRLEYKRKLGSRFAAATVLIDNCELNEDGVKKNAPELLPYLEGYRKFRTIEKFEPLHKEVRLFSKKWRCHGAPDEIAIFENSLAIVEYKCTWTLYPSTAAQTANYEMFVKENGKELGIDPYLLKKKIRRFGIVFKETGNYAPPEEFKCPNDFQDIKAALWLHWRRRERYKTSKGEIYDNAAA